MTSRKVGPLEQTTRRYGLAVTRQLAILFVAFYLLLACCNHAVRGQDGPVAWWSFDEANAEHARDRAGGIDDQVIGNTLRVGGVVKRALKCDGFTARVIRRVVVPLLAVSLLFGCQASSSLPPRRRPHLVS